MPTRFRIPGFPLTLAALLLAAGSCARNRTPAGANGDAHEAPATAASVPQDPRTAFAQKTVKECARAGGDQQACNQRALNGVLKAEGVGAAMETLDRMATLDRSVRQLAHEYAHEIGINAYTSAEEVDKVFAQCTPAYQSGCYHGVIQAYFMDPHGPAAKGVTAASVNRLCQDYRGPSGNPWLLFHCTHGMGHGLTMLHDHDLPEALRGCDLLSTVEGREACYGGAFMENVINVTMPHHAGAELAGNHDHASTASMAGMEHMHGGDSSRPRFKPIDPNDPLYPCSALADKYQYSCYLMQTSIILYLNGWDVAAAGRTCARAPESMRRTCYISLGRDISGAALQDPGESIRMCSRVQPEAQSACHTGVVATIIQVTARTNEGMQYCKKLGDPESKTGCYAIVGQQLQMLEREPVRRDAICRTAEEPYVVTCRVAAGLPY